MLVPKEETDLQRKKLKKFKKLNLQLYQKNYRLYENEFIVLDKPKTTNPILINNIGEKLRIAEEPTKQFKGLMAQISVKDPANLNQKNFFKRYDYNYNHSVNLPMDENWTFHFNSNLQSKNDFGLFQVTPSFSYHTAEVYYRAGVTWGPQTDFYLMAMKQVSENVAIGMVTSFLEKDHFSKDKFIASIRYKNLLAYSSFGSHQTFGIRAYPALYRNMKFYLNPYIGRGGKGLVAGLSRKLTDISNIKLELTYTDWIVALKTAIQLRINSWTKLYLNCELHNRSIYLGAGMKLKHFYFGLPLFSTGQLTLQDIKWAGPIVLAATLIGLKWDKIRKWLFRESKPKVENVLTLDDKIAKRQQELKLISRRVKEIFNDEMKKNGFIVLEGYYGARALIENLRIMNQSDKIKNLLTEPYSSKVLDVTDSMRFYVEDSKLHIPKRSKNNLYGVYTPQVESTDELVLYIRYTFQGIEKEAMIGDADEAQLP